MEFNVDFLNFIEEFEYPKGMSVILNKAMQWANITKPWVIGSTSEMYRKFTEETGHTDVIHWERYYNQNALVSFDASVKRAIEWIERELCWIKEGQENHIRNYLWDLLYRKTAQGFHIQDIILKEISKVTHAKKFRHGDKAEEVKGKDIFLNDIVFSVKSDKYGEYNKIGQEVINVPIIYYRVKSKSRGSKEKVIVFNIDDDILEEIKRANAN